MGTAIRMNLDRELTNRYFLGTTTNAEDEEIGVRIIEDMSFADEMSQAEIDLIEDYLEGGLTDSETELFEQQYLVSDERRERVREIALLKRYARGAQTSASVEPVAKNIPWFRRFTVLVPVFGLVIIAVIAGLLLVGDKGGSDYAQLNRQNLRDPSVIGNAQVVEITPGTYRSGTPGPVIVVGGDSPAVLFRLPLNFSVDPNTIYDASIDHDGRKVFTVDGVRLYMEGGTLEARVLAPREVLSTGTHHIRLVRRESDNAPVVYTFEIR